MRARSLNVVDQLRSQGVIALDDWVSQCIAYLTTTGTISNNSNETRVLDAVLRVYLDSDIYITKDEFNQLPQNINEFHNVRLFPEQLRVLQIDEVVDIGASSQRVSQEAAKAEEGDEEGAHLQTSAFGKHLLKAFLSDGEHQAIGLDLNGALLTAYHAHVSRIRGPDKPSIFSFFAGAKIAVKNVLVRRGALVLTADSVKFLGGAVARLQDLNAGQAAAVAVSAPPAPSAPAVASRQASSVSVHIPLTASEVGAGAAGTTVAPSRNSNVPTAAPTAAATLSVDRQLPRNIHSYPEPASSGQLQRAAQPPPVSITVVPAPLAPLHAAPPIVDGNIYSNVPIPPPSKPSTHHPVQSVAVSAPVPASTYAPMQVYDDGGFYDDVPFTNDGPLLTCDLTLSQSPVRHVQSHSSPVKVGNERHEVQLWGGADVDAVVRGTKEEEEGGARMEVDEEVERGSQQSPQWAQEQPSEWHFGHSQFEDADNSNMPAGEADPHPEPSDATTEPAPLQRWEQILHDWDCSAEMYSEAFVRVRGITNRLIRLKTTAATKPQFDVALELDDGHSIVACQVSSDLVERFLDMSAADYCALLEQLAGDRAAKKQTVRGVMNRFQHFHGLFWVCRKAPTAAAAAGVSKSSKAKSEQVEEALLVDFADEDVAGLCRALLRQQRS